MDANPAHMAGMKMPALATAAQRFRFTHLSGSSRVIGGSIGRLPVEGGGVAEGTACLRKRAAWACCHERPRCMALVLDAK